jgi:hypothetical protein
MGLLEGIFSETEDLSILPGGCPRGGGGAPESVLPERIDSNDPRMETE